MGLWLGSEKRIHKGFGVLVKIEEVFFIGIVGVGLLWWFGQDSGYASGFNPRGYDTTTRGGYVKNGTDNTIWVWNPYYVGTRGR